LGFIEANHIEPLSATKDEREVRPSDFAMLCANCHRMIHNQMLWLAVEELKEIVIFTPSGKP